MNKPTLVLQFRTDQSLEHEQKCIKQAGDYKDSDLEIINILDPKARIPKPNDLDKYAAVITGASGQFNLTNWPPKIKARITKLLPFFRELINRDFPTLSICFGHQLVAQLLGGKVQSDDNQAEAGTYKITLTSDGKRSKLFKNIPAKFWAVLGHKDSVTKLPREATLLASSKRCKNQSYRLGKNFYSVQFHPELDREALIWRLKLYPEYLKDRTLDEIRAEYHEIKYAQKVIDNFRKIVEENNS